MYNNSNQANKSQDLVNNKIKYKTVIVIDNQGNNLGEMNTKDAISLAEQNSLDLLVIAIQNNKPIARILDYGKYKFELKRKQKNNKKNNSIKIKEIKVKPLIGDHDLNVRAENAKKWLSQGNKVKFIIEARGRLSTKQEFIVNLYDKFIKLLSLNENKFNIVQSNKQVNNFRYETIIESK